MATLALLLTACNKGERPVLGDLVIDSVTCDAIHCHAEVIDHIPDYCAFCYGTTQSEAEKKHSKNNQVTGTCSATLIKGTVDKLKPNTTYYIRAYAMNSNGRTYTETIATTTLPSVPAMDDNLFPGTTE